MMRIQSCKDFLGKGGKYKIPKVERAQGSECAVLVSKKESVRS